MKACLADESVIRYLLSHHHIDPEAVIQDFTSRYHQVVAGILLQQLHLSTTAEVYCQREELNDFCVAMNDLLMAVYHSCMESTRECPENIDGNKQ